VNELLAFHNALCANPIKAEGHFFDQNTRIMSACGMVRTEA
jgi:hypothetical protein